MHNKTKRLFALAGALLFTVVLWGALMTGTAQGQSDQPYTPGAGSPQEMMGRWIGNVMAGGFGIQSSVALTDTSAQSAWHYGMMSRMMNGQMNGMMNGQMNGMMSSMMNSMMGSTPVTGTMPYTCPHVR